MKKKYIYPLFLVSVLMLIPLFNILAFDFNADSGLGIMSERTGHADNALFGDSNNMDAADRVDFAIARIIQLLLSFMGLIFMLLLIYGGILWMTAMGNEQRVEKAKNIIVESIIGIAIIVSAYAITLLIINAFGA